MFNLLRLLGEFCSGARPQEPARSGSWGASCRTSDGGAPRCSETCGTRWGRCRPPSLSRCLPRRRTGHVQIHATALLTLIQRQLVHGPPCDIRCIGRESRLLHLQCECGGVTSPVLQPADTQPTLCHISTLKHINLVTDFLSLQIPERALHEHAMEVAYSHMCLN